MAMINPCCCMSLQKGTIVLAIVDAIVNIILLILYTLAFIGLLTLKTSDYHEYEITEHEKIGALVFCTLIIFVTICYIMLAAYLRQGARQNDAPRCKKWLMIEAFLFAVKLISLIINMATSSFGTYYLVSGLLGSVYKIYEMFVVFSFMKELNNGGGLSNTYYAGA